MVNAKEQFYDDKIAPLLKEIALLCHTQGLNMAAVVFNENDLFRTALLDREKAAQRLVDYVIKCQGNADLLIRALLEDAEKYGHNSVYLDLLLKKLNQKA